MARPLKRASRAVLDFFIARSRVSLLTEKMSAHSSRVCPSPPRVSSFLMSSGLRRNGGFLIWGIGFILPIYD